MYTKTMFVSRIKIIALSQIRQIIENVRQDPAEYKKDTLVYCEAMYGIICEMSPERLKEIVETVYKGYESIGFSDDAVIADSLMTLALAEYQNEISEENVYDLHWTKFVEDFFKNEASAGECMF
jgi:hypothetical protein